MLLTNVDWASACVGFVCPQGAVCAMAPASGHRTTSFRLSARRQSRENSASAVRQLQSFSQTEGENHELLT